MAKTITVDKVTYEVLEESNYPRDEKLIFQLRKNNKYEYVLGLWNEMLGQPVRKVWKIVGIVKES